MDSRAHVLFYNLNHFLKILVSILMVKESIGQFLERFEKAIKIHLIIVAPPDHILVYYIVVCLQDMAIGEALVLA